MSKDNYTPEMRAAYNRAYRYKFKAPKVELIGPPKPKLCDCRRDWGMIHRGTEQICHRCKALEAVDFHSNQINEDLAIQRNISPAWLLRQLQAFQEEIKTWIEDRGNELVVHGHGEYHLTLT